MKLFWKSLCLLLLIGLSSTACSSGNKSEINTSTVKELDLKRFMGKWYEIARYDHRFEEGMTHVTAEYSLLPNGKIEVINRGIQNGKLKEIIGKARQTDPKHYPGRLEVSFFLWFYSPYYILDLGKDYQYALIGSDTDNYMWILSRSPQLPEETMNKLLNELKQRGYDTSRLIYVEQKE